MSWQNTLVDRGEELHEIKNSEVPSVTSKTSWEITSNLSSSKEFLHWKKWLVIDENYGSWFLAKACLEKLWAETIILKNTESIKMYMDNVDVDYIVFCPKFERDWSGVLLQEDIKFLDFMKTFYSNVPIFAYTADIMSWEIQKLSSLNFADIIKKPMNISYFNNSMKENLRPDLINLEKGLSLEKN